MQWCHQHVEDENEGYPLETPASSTSSESSLGSGALDASHNPPLRFLSYFRRPERPSMLLFDAECCRHPRDSVWMRAQGKCPPKSALMLLAAALPHDPDSPGRGNGAKKEGDFCRKGCSHSPCLSLSGLAGVSASSAALLPAGLMSRGGGGSGEPAARTTFPPASRPPRNSLR